MCTVGNKQIRVRNGTVLAEGYHLAASELLPDGVVCKHLRAEIAVRCIDICSENVHVLITRIPVKAIGCCIGSPDPDQVLKPMMINQTVKHQPPEHFAGLRSFRTPPEPTSGGLVKRSEQNRDLVIVELFKVTGYDVYVAQHSLVFRRGGFGDL